MSTAKATMDNARETIETYAAKPAEMVREHPVPASLVLFGIGMGVGLLLTSHVMQTVAPPETTSERLGRQFNDALNEIRGALHRGFSAMR